MKKKKINTLFLSAVFFSAAVFLMSMAFVDEKGLARVNKVNGYEAYFMSEPLRDFEVVLDERNGLQMTSLLTAGVANESVSDKATQLVNKIIKEAKKTGKDFDAIIYSNGKKAAAIKFKDQPAADTKGIGRAHKINGIEVYVLADPLRDYEILNDAKGGLKMKSLLTAGLVNNSIEEDVEKLVKKLVAEDHKIEALVYSAGKSAIGVRFKN